MEQTVPCSLREFASVQLRSQVVPGFSRSIFAVRHELLCFPLDAVDRAAMRQRSFRRMGLRSKSAEGRSDGFRHGIQDSFASGTLCSVCFHLLAPS